MHVLASSDGSMWSSWSPGAFVLLAVIVVIVTAYAVTRRR